MPIIIILTPYLRIIGLYVAAAVLPAALLLHYIYKKDPFEKEPPRLLASLLALGVAAAVAAAALERAGARLLPLLLPKNSPLYIPAFTFLIIALAEEGAKLLFLSLRTWRAPEFNRRFDGIVYAVFISLGFAAFENILYAFGYGLRVTLPRALTAIPAHMSFGVFMGLFYGRARACARRHRFFARTFYSALAFLIPILLHGLYDTAAMTGTRRAAFFFFGFAAALYALTFFLIKKEAASDRYI